MDVVGAGIPKSTVTFDRVWATVGCCPKYVINTRVTIAKQIGSSLGIGGNLNVNCIIFYVLSLVRAGGLCMCCRDFNRRSPRLNDSIVAYHK